MWEFAFVLPFAFARNIKPINNNQFAIILYIFISGIFQMVDNALWRITSNYYWLYHIYTPLALGFTIYILLTLYSEDVDYIVLLTAILVTVTVCLIDLFTSYKEIDKLTTFISSSFEITMGVFLISRFKLSDYRTYILLAFIIDGVMNLFAYPQYNLESYIVCNLFFFISILFMWLKNGNQ